MMWQMVSCHTLGYQPIFFTECAMLRTLPQPTFLPCPQKNKVTSNHDYRNTLPNLYYSILQDTKLSSKCLNTRPKLEYNAWNPLSIQRHISYSHSLSQMQEALLKDPTCNLQFEFQNQGVWWWLCNCHNRPNCLHNHPVGDIASVQDVSLHQPSAPQPLVNPLQLNVVIITC